jgi:hypothetical protein
VKLGVVGPAVDDERRKQLKIQPQIEPIFRALVADNVHGAGLVEFGIDLTPAIAGN